MRISDWIQTCALPICHDPDFELIEVHIAQLRAFASADDGPIFLGHALERRVAQEYARRAGPEDVNDGARAPASQGQGREHALGGVELLKSDGVASEIVGMGHKLENVFRGDALELEDRKSTRLNSSH